MDLMPMAAKGTLRKHLNITKQTERELGKHTSFGSGHHHTHDYQCKWLWGQDLNSISLALDLKPYRVQYHV
jgi:hypothetical protein